MPCYSCSSEFGFLKKEVGCDICGFSFCSRCCKKQEVPSKQGNLIKQLVCNKCYNNLTSDQVKMSRASPPLAHKKRMAALNKRSFSMDSGSHIPTFSEKDKEIAVRLQRLKRDKIKDTLPSEDDIAERLARLKGIEPSKYKAPPIEVYRPPDMRTCVEQTVDLMKQMELEAELDSRLVKPEDEIAARLARLRDEDPEKMKDTKKASPDIDLSKFQSHHEPAEEMDIDKSHVQWQKDHASTSEIAFKDVQSLMEDPEYQKLMLDIEKKRGNEEEGCEEDDEEEANKLVEKLLATDDVEQLDSLNEDIDQDSISKNDKDTTEEFPWCIICTEDAKIRCFDCDSDIYCLRCFKECHDSLEITDHKTCPYLPEKNTAL